MPEERASKKPSGWWIPVLAAALGLVGGIAGAYVGGQVSNDGQEQQFENQRTAQIQDLAIETYSNYLRTSALTWGAVSNQASDQDERQAESVAALGVVKFETGPSPEIGAAADKLLVAAIEPASNADYFDAQQQFIEAAANSLSD
jgi:hypothetical protein